MMLTVSILPRETWETLYRVQCLYEQYEKGVF